jgi:single-stranded-DNA-specific exonuclease
MEICGGNSIMAQALTKRGIMSPLSVQSFLDPAKYSPAPIQDLPGLAPALDRLVEAVRCGATIGVWGDFDADGQTATTILVSALRQVDAKVFYHIPVRGNESHGIDLAVLKKFLGSGIDLLLTCDTGSSANEAVEYCKTRNIDTIVTDHHLVAGKRAEPLALINPSLLSKDHPLKTLSGAGVAYLFAKAIYAAFDQEQDKDALLDLAAIGTIADVVELKQDVRYLVQRGLAALQHSNRMLLKCMCKMTDLDQRNISEEHVSYLIAPRLNALGRLGDTNPIVEMFLSENEEAVQAFAQSLEKLNYQRKMLCDQVFKAANEKVQQDPSMLRDPVLILTHPAWPVGVLGIAASRLSERYQRPTILLHAPPDGLAAGSARSVEGINITELIATAASILNTYGGHSQAAGLSLPTEDIPKLKRMIREKASAMDPTTLPSAKVEIDAQVNIGDLHSDLINDLERLAPFGPGNPAPIFMAKGIFIKNRKPLGREKEHLLLEIEDTHLARQKVIWWQGAGNDLPEGELDLAYHARMQNYRGQEQLQVEVIDLRPARSDEIHLITPNKCEVIDLRRRGYTFEQLIQEFRSPEILIWREGLTLQRSLGYDRMHLKPCNSLLIATIPPSRRELSNALAITGAYRVILYDLHPGSKSLKDILHNLAGLLKYAIRAEEKEALPARFAATLGITTELSEAGVLYLIRRNYSDIGTIPPPLKDFAANHKDIGEPELRDWLSSLTTEMDAFREYYLRAEGNDLIQ